MIFFKIHLISQGCPRSSISLQCRIVALKHWLFIWCYKTCSYDIGFLLHRMYCTGTTFRTYIFRKYKIKITVWIDDSFNANICCHAYIICINLMCLCNNNINNDNSKNINKNNDNNIYFYISLHPRINTYIVIIYNTYYLPSYAYHHRKFYLNSQHMSRLSNSVFFQRILCAMPGVLITRNYCEM